MMNKYLVRVKRVSSFDQTIVEADNVKNENNVIYFLKNDKVVYCVSVFSLIDFRPTEWSNR